MNYKNIYIYNILIFLFLLELLLYFITMITHLLLSVMVPFMIVILTTWAEKKYTSPDIDTYLSKIQSLDLFTNIPITLLLGIFFTSLIFKFIHLKSKTIEFINDKKTKYKIIEDSKEEIKNIVKVKKLYITKDTTFIKKNKIYISILDLLNFSNKTNANGLFIIYHELHHLKSGDTNIGFYTIILNQILTTMIIFLLGYITLIMSQDFLSTFNFFIHLPKIFQTFLKEFVLLFIIGFIFYKFFFFNKYISKFKECLADRTAHIYLNKQNLLYSYEIFERTSSIKHPLKEERIACANGNSHLVEKVILYFGILELLIIVPSFTNNDFFYFTLIIHINYLLVIFTILRLTLKSINLRILRKFLIFYPILLWIKLKLIVFLSANALNDIFINLNKSDYLDKVSINIDIITVNIAILTYGYIIYERFRKHL